MIIISLMCFRLFAHSPLCFCKVLLHVLKKHTFFFCGSGFRVTSAPLPCSVKERRRRIEPAVAEPGSLRRLISPLTCICEENTQQQRENQKRWEESREIKEMRLGVRWKRGEGLDRGRMSGDEDGWHSEWAEGESVVTEGGGWSFTEIMISLLLQRPLSNHFSLWLSEMEETALCHVGRQPLG